MNEHLKAMQALFERAQAGCPQATEEFVRTYGKSIRAAIRYRLNERVRSLYDSEDLLQDVWLFFWQVIPNRRHFESPEHLRAFCKGVADNKVREVHRHCHQQQRDIDREVRLEDPTVLEPAARQPGPGDELAERDKWEWWLEKQPSDLREIAIALQEGQTLVEIAKARGVSVKTIRRAKEKIRESLSDIYPPPASVIARSHPDAFRSDHAVRYTDKVKEIATMPGQG